MNTKGIISAVILATLAMAGHAQKEEGNKIIVEITREVNGEKQTFKGEYNSAEEMRADPNYREAAGEESGFNFWFDGDEDQSVFLQLDQMKDLKGSAFHFFNETDSIDKNHFFFHKIDRDSVDGFLNVFLEDMDWADHRQRMAEVGVEMDQIFKQLQEGNEFFFESKQPKLIRVEDDTEEFGNRAKVSADKELKLANLHFFPNPSPMGRINLRFLLEKSGDLTISVSDLNGKNVFSRYFEEYSGSYSESIDLSRQKEGSYLLEISSRDKRLTRKIVVE